MKKWLLLAIKILISIALIAWVFKAKEIDVGAALERVGELSPALIVPALLAFASQIVICSFRWRAVLGAIGGVLSFRTGLRLQYIGAFFHQTLPASVGGDAVRTYLAYRHGVSLRTAVNGIMLERVVTLAGLILLVAAVQPAFLPRVGESAGAWMVPVVGVALALVLGGVLVLAMLDRLPQSTHRWAVVRALANLATDTRALFFSPGAVITSVGWAMAGHSALTLGVFVLARALGIEISLVDCFALFLPVLLLTALPVSIAGWGLREGGMVYAFGLIGVPGESALVLSILYGLFTLSICLPGGLVWLATGVRRGDLKAALAKAGGPTEAESERADRKGPP